MTNKNNGNGRTIPDDVIKELNEVPIHSVCDALGISYYGDCPSGHDSQGHNCFRTFPHTNTWYCYHCVSPKVGTKDKLFIGCIGLVETKLKCNTPEACRWIADRFRPDLKQSISSMSNNAWKKYQEKMQKTEQVYKAFNYAVDYYNKKLWENKEAIDYLKGRKITEDFIRDNPYVKFGYASLKQEDLRQELCSKFGEEITLATGLFSKSGKGFIYPTMKIWIEELKKEIPVITYSYQMGGYARYIIGRRFTPALEGETRDHRFSKLKLKEDGIIKNEIFGMDSLSIKNPLFKDSVLISEGLFDAILAIQNNIPCISPITVTFSDKQKTEMCKTVRKFKTVYIVPDPDSPGEKGAVETARQLIKEGKSVKVVTLPRIEGIKKFDLADYFKQHTAEDFLKLCSQGISLIDFLIQSIPQETEKPDLKKLLEDKDIIKTIHAMDAITQEYYRGILSERFKLEMSTVKELFIDIQTPVKAGPLPPRPEGAGGQEKVNISEKLSDINNLNYDSAIDQENKIEDNWLVENLFARGVNFSVLFGEPGVCKTWLVLSEFLKLADGKIIFGKYETEPRKTVLLEADFPANVFEYRLKRLYKPENVDNFIMYSADKLQDVGFEYCMDTTQGQEVIEGLMEREKPDILIIDSLGSWIQGDEVKQDVIKPVIEFLKKISKKFNLHILLIHHPRKRSSIERLNRLLDMSDATGSFLLARYASTIYTVNGIYDEEGRVENKGLVINVKNWFKTSPKFEFSMEENKEGKIEFSFEYDEYTSFTDKKQGTRQAILENLKASPEGLTKKQLEKYIPNVSLTTIERALGELKKAGKIVSIGITRNLIYKLKQLQSNTSDTQNTDVNNNKSIDIYIDNSIHTMKGIEENNNEKKLNSIYSNSLHVVNGINPIQDKGKNSIHVNTCVSGKYEGNTKCSSCIFSIPINSDKNLYKCEKGTMTDYNGLTERSCCEFKYKTGPAEVLQVEDHKRKYNEALKDSNKDVMAETIVKLNAIGIKATLEELKRGFELCRT